MFRHPDAACEAFNYLWRYSKNINALYETPEAGEDPDDLLECRRRAASIISSSRENGRTLLNEYESKKLLEAYGIPTVKTEVAHKADEAVKLAEQIGFPVLSSTPIPLRIRQMWGG
jgi:acetyltransferase